MSKDDDNIVIPIIENCKLYESGKTFAWQILKKFAKLSTSQKKDIFGNLTLLQILNKYDPNTLYEKISEYEQEREDIVNYAYVDGSYNNKTKVYGYGAILVYDGNVHELSGHDSDPDMVDMRNVAGEIMGVMETIKYALDCNIKEITIYYDYTGIEYWATGAWKRNKTGTIKYYDFMQKAQCYMKIHFVKVAAHSGIEGNEKADELAKKAVGLI